MPPVDLEKHLEGLEPDLRLVLSAIAAACADVSVLLRTASTHSVGTLNDCGDSQIAADVAADKAVLDRLSSLASVAVSTVSSEERTDERELGGSSYSVAYDPLDGSSVAGAGWAVGAIFGVWPGRGLVGRRGDEQAAAAYAVFGPRATLVVASPRRRLTGEGGEEGVEEEGGEEEGGEEEGGEEGSKGSTRVSDAMVVDEFLLNSAGKWALAKAGIRLDRDGRGDGRGDGRRGGDDEKEQGRERAPSRELPQYFAPANLRAARDNVAYKRLVLELMSPAEDGGAPATLRYTGALVADVHHILSKGDGVFLNPASVSAPPKLRFMYEVAPLALVVEAAGGAAEDGDGRVLEKSAARPDSRCVVALGTRGAVSAARDALVEGGGSL